MIDSPLQLAFYDTLSTIRPSTKLESHRKGTDLREMLTYFEIPQKYTNAIDRYTTSRGMPRTEIQLRLYRVCKRMRDIWKYV